MAAHERWSGDGIATMESYIASSSIKRQVSSPHKLHWTLIANSKRPSSIAGLALKQPHKQRGNGLTRHGIQSSSFIQLQFQRNVAVPQRK